MEDTEILRQELEIAKKNGFRPELVAALEARINAASGSPQPEKQKIFGDNKELFKLYQRTKEWLIKHEAESTQNIFDQSVEAYDHQKYLQALDLIEKIEDEGRQRGILFFLSPEEQKKKIDEVFKQGQGT